MITRTVQIFSGHIFEVPECIQRIDSKRTHGWQLRYGPWKMFSDGSKDGSGAAQSLAVTKEELIIRINLIDAPTGLRKAINQIKSTNLPVGISGPICLTRKTRNILEYYLGVSIPRFGEKPTNANIYIGTENTFSQEKYDKALAKAIQIRLDAEILYQKLATKSKRKSIRTK